jgi:ribosomal protein RSM22 (predicted rRNA methylase)
MELKNGLERLAHGISRNAMAAQAAAQSRHYRAGGGSQDIATTPDALAYAFTRMPATYAATIAVLEELRDALPAFAPRNVLDVGAGPGTASFAAAAAFASISEFRLVDANACLRELALTLLAGAEHEALRRVADCRAYRLGDALALPGEVEPADIVIASYVAGEIADRELERFAQALWAATAGALAIIEPGTPAGYARIMRVREELIAAGAHVAAPCPHARACPLHAPDWCHFAQRLPRSRDHLRIKGAEVPYEDERFSYVVLSRIAARAIEARVLAPPKISKSAATAKLCTDGGVVIDTAARRDSDAYRRRKSWRWGESVVRKGPVQKSVLSACNIVALRSTICAMRARSPSSGRRR